MRLSIRTIDDAPDEKEWVETWAPYLTEREVVVYQALRRGDREIDSSVLARGAGLSTNAVDRAIERLEVVGLLETYDEA